MNAVPSCPNNHPVAFDASFCGMCGAAVVMHDQHTRSLVSAQPSHRPMPNHARSTDFGPYVPYQQASAAYHQPVEPGTTLTGAPPLAFPMQPQADGRRKSAKTKIGLGVFAFSAIAAVIVGFAVSNTSDAPAQTTVTGQLELTDYETAGAGCVGQGGYDDITEGATVILTNQDGKILGSTALDAGEGDTDSGTCTYSFSVADVPMNEAQYAVEVTHRGKIVNSRADMMDQDWAFSISLGD